MSHIMNFIACEPLLFDIFSDIFIDIAYDQSVDRVIELKNFSNYIDAAYFIRYFRAQLHIILAQLDFPLSHASIATRGGTRPCK